MTRPDVRSSIVKKCARIGLRPAIALGTFCSVLGLLTADRPAALVHAQTHRLFPHQPMLMAQLTASQYMDQDWTLANWQEGGSARAVVPGGAPTLRFSADGLGGNGGCNVYRSAYSIEDGDRLSVGAMMSTRRACLNPELSAQEGKFFQALSGAKSLTMGGDGTLQIQYQDQGQSGVLTFRSEQSANQPSASSQPTADTQQLAQSQWKLSTWQEGSVSRDILPDTKLTIAFSKRQLSGHSGCNRYGGPYQQQGSELTVGDLEMTEMGCEPSDIMQQESEWLAALIGTHRIEQLNDQQLVINYERDGKTGQMTFAKRAAAPDRGQEVDPETEDSATVTSDGEVSTYDLPSDSGVTKGTAGSSFSDDEGMIDGPTGEPDEGEARGIKPCS